MIKSAITERMLFGVLEQFDERIAYQSNPARADVFQIELKGANRLGIEVDHAGPLLDVGVAELNAPAVDHAVVQAADLAQHAADLSGAIGWQGAEYFERIVANNTVGGKLVGIPWYTDAGILYYRTDLLEKHGQAVPRTWNELARVARHIQQAEGRADLQGLSVQGAPVEGAVCTFLLPYWSQGKTLQDLEGRPTLDRAAATRGLQQWLTLMDQGVIKRNAAEVKTPDTVNEFKTGKVLFALNWSWAWDRLQKDADSRVRGQVAVMPLPAMDGGGSATCIGGWQWAVSAFSRHKAEAARLVQFMSTPQASQFLAVQGALLPTYAEVYADPAVLAQVPWFADAAAVVRHGRSRPVTARYGEVSDAIRSATNAVLARARSPEDAAADVDSRLRRVMR